MRKIAIYYNNQHSVETSSLKKLTMDLFQQSDQFIVLDAETIGEAVKEVDKIKPDYFVTLERSSHIAYDTTFISANAHELNETIIDFLSRSGFVLRHQDTMYTVNENVKCACFYIVLTIPLNSHIQHEEDFAGEIVNLLMEEQEEKPAKNYTVMEHGKIIIKTSSYPEAARICDAYRAGRVYDEYNTLVYRTRPGRVHPIPIKTDPIKRIKTLPNRAFQKIAKKVTVK